MYSNTYPRLKAKYNVDNFEFIAKTIDKHFGDLFKLDVLESEAAKSGALGSYASLFAKCMAKLGGLYTVEEVLKKLRDLLQSDCDIRNQLLTTFIFVTIAWIFFRANDLKDANNI